MSFLVWLKDQVLVICNYAFCVLVLVRMSWETIRRQTASLVPVATDNGELSIILCRREEARSEVFYDQMEKN
mgnify:CR=1 FL=1